MTFVAAKTEMPRLRDQVPKVFDRVLGIEMDFSESLPPLLDSVLRPGQSGYSDALSAIVRPIVGERAAPRWGSLNGFTR